VSGHNPAQLRSGRLQPFLDAMAGAPPATGGPQLQPTLSLRNRVERQHLRSGDALITSRAREALGVPSHPAIRGMAHWGVTAWSRFLFSAVLSVGVAESSTASAALFPQRGIRHSISASAITALSGDPWLAHGIRCFQASKLQDRLPGLPSDFSWPAAISRWAGGTMISIKLREKRTTHTLEVVLFWPTDSVRACGVCSSSPYRSFP